MLFQNEKLLTNYYVKLMDTAKQFCYQVNTKGELHFSVRNIMLCN